MIKVAKPIDIARVSKEELKKGTVLNTYSYVKEKRC